MNDVQWFERLYARHEQALLAMGRCMLTENADAVTDVVQDVFLLAWEHRRELMIHPNAGGWLMQALKYRIQSLGNKARRRRAHLAFSLDEAPELEWAGGEMTPERQLLMEARKDALREVLGEENAKLFLAYVLEDRSVRELTGQTGLTESGIYRRLQRMRRALLRRSDLFGTTLVLLVLAGKRGG